MKILNNDKIHVYLKKDSSEPFSDEKLSNLIIIGRLGIKVL